MHPNAFNAQTRFLKLNGLYIETQWDWIRWIGVFMCIILCTVAVGKLVWNSWEVVFGAGSFMITLPMLALTAMSYFEDHNM